MELHETRALYDDDTCTARPYHKRLLMKPLFVEFVTYLLGSKGVKWRTENETVDAVAIHCGAPPIVVPIFRKMDVANPRQSTINSRFTVGCV